jgi:hypothetical protein
MLEHVTATSSLHSLVRSDSHRGESRISHKLPMVTICRYLFFHRPPMTYPLSDFFSFGGAPHAFTWIQGAKHDTSCFYLDPSSCFPTIPKTGMALLPCRIELTSHTTRHAYLRRVARSMLFRNCGACP